jgi:hypothetical protein
MAPITLPGWLQALIDSGAGTAEGLRWYTPEERVAAAQQQGTTFEGGNLWMMDEMRAAANQGWGSKLRVGEGPKTYIDHAASCRLQFWLDGDRPDTLWVGPERSPPFLWFSGGRDATSLLSAVRPYLPTDLAQPRPHLPPGQMVRRQLQAVQGPIPGAAQGQSGRVRMMVGIAMAQSDQGLADIENHLMVCGFVDPQFLMQGTCQGNPRSNPTVTVVRTLYSRSTVRLDWYDSLSGTLFADISYAPAGQHDTIRAFDEAFGLHYPPDMPVDVPALLLGLEAITVPALQAHMARRLDDPERLNFYLYCLAILSNPDIAEPLRPFASHPSPLIRATVIDLAAQRAPELLQAMRAVETDAALREKIEQALSR